MTTKFTEETGMGRFISIEQARDMTARFRQERENILKEEYQGKEVLPVCESFQRDNFDVLLDMQGCTGIRVYMGMDEKFKVRAIVTAFGEDFQDILNDPVSLSSLANLDPPPGGPLEDGARCPDICPNPPL